MRSLAAVAALLLVLSGCGDGTGHLASLNYEFDHPPRWQSIADVEFPNASDRGADTVGLDRRNWVTVASEGLERPLTDAQLAAAPRDLRERLGTALAAAGVRIVAAPRLTRHGELPALEYEIAFTDDDGTPLHSRAVTLFAGALALSVGCQWTPARAQEIGAGCRQVLATLEPLP